MTAATTAPAKKDPFGMDVSPGDDPAARIRWMKERVEQRKADAAAEEGRRKQRNKREQECRDALHSLLAPLAGIPVNDADGRGDGDGVTLVCRDATREGWAVRVVRRFDREGETCDETVVSFAVASDASGAWVEHDGTRVTGDVALDLATAAVEARFDG